MLRKKIRQGVLALFVSFNCRRQVVAEVLVVLAGDFPFRHPYHHW